IAAALIAWTVIYVWSGHIVRSANAHDLYEWQCCHDKDCAPVDDAAVMDTPDGLRIVATGETVKFGDPMIRRPIDERVHICRNPYSNKLLCIYPKLRGF